MDTKLKVIFKSYSIFVLNHCIIWSSISKYAPLQNKFLIPFRLNKTDHEPILFCKDSPSKLSN